MQNTTNYALPYPEGSDTVNLLTVLPALAQLVDAQMKVNANTGIQRGSHSKSGTVNAITVPTNLATGTFFTFVASDDFVEGDSFTFNGEVIAARTPQGKALKTDAFTINQNVLCCNYNGILTIYTNQAAIAVDQELDAESENAIANAAVDAAVKAINAAIGSADISTIGANVKAAIVALNNSIGSANGAISAINGQLTYAGKTFYLDEKNGKLGMNTDPARGADTFTPFSSGAEFEMLWTNPAPSQNFPAQVISIPNIADYKGILFRGARVAGNPTQVDPMYVPVVIGDSNDVWATMDRSATGVSPLYRQFTYIEGVGIDVSLGKTYATAYAYANYCIPVEIIGIK